MKQGKIWGQTNLVFSNCNNEVQYMKCKAGNQCSKHCHVHKHNMFYVINGKLKILVWKNDYDLCDETILGPGERTVVKPNEYHQFQVIEDAEVLEVYWVELLLSDIQRESCGGIIDNQDNSPSPIEQLVAAEKKRVFEVFNNDKSLLDHSADYLAEQEVNNANEEYTTSGDRVVTRKNGK